MMVNTYINDRKLEEYPFYDIGKAPFPPGCIRYLGVCIVGTPNGRPIYASSISVSLDGVLVSLCRETANDAGEPVGSVYVEAGKTSVSMALTGSSFKGSVSMWIDRNMMKNSYGNYTGKFYLDPSCVTYRDLGGPASIVVNGTTIGTEQGLDFSCRGGVIQFTEDNGDVLLSGTTDVDSYNLVASSGVSSTFVDAIGTQVPTTVDTVAPVFQILSGDADAVKFSVLRGSEVTDSDNPPDPSDLVIEILGTTDFPNCYDSRFDEALPQEEADNAVDDL